MTLKIVVTCDFCTLTDTTSRHVVTGQELAHMLGVVKERMELQKIRLPKQVSYDACPSCSKKLEAELQEHRIGWLSDEGET